MSGNNNANTSSARPPRPPKGHRQKGAGTVIVDKGPIVTNDGIVLKCMYCMLYCINDQFDLYVKYYYSVLFCYLHYLHYLHYVL